MECCYQAIRVTQRALSPGGAVERFDAALNALFNSVIQNGSKLWLHGVVDERRTFNTPLREPLNPIISHMLKAVDWHISTYWSTGDQWHLEQAQAMRNYVLELKDWVMVQEMASRAAQDE
jgi:hypothetical protein